ncbi:hypothetical protein K439DRAFT_268886 [Ramaria rubella]|nr:hypothetical protein K439DRAFT_268886 [Ramaria rubella]
MSTFLILRYFSFVLFIIFNSVICVVAALNLGTLPPNITRLLDRYLIVLGALGLVMVFSVIFIELIRKNAFIARVSTEIGWVGLLWVMHLSAAVTAIFLDIQCPATGLSSDISCVPTKALLALTWISTITFLSYLLGLVVSAVHHSQADSNVWRSGVRDFQWFTQRKVTYDLPRSTPSYGKLSEPKISSGPPPIYAQQMGLPVNYFIEPLTIQRPMPPILVATSGSQIIANEYSHARPATPPAPSPYQYSLYPQHLQATVGVLPNLSSRASGSSPPPAGIWPRSNPQEPKPKRHAHGSAPNLSASVVIVPDSPGPRKAGRRGQSEPMLSAARSRPSGPRMSSQRPRPPPLDLSSLTKNKPWN